jgi:hypothetical protein
VVEISEGNTSAPGDYPNDPRALAATDVAIGFLYDGATFTPHATHAAELALAAQTTLNQKHRAYLASTDYFAIREYEGGKPMPANIKELRAAARQEIKQ